MSGSIVSPNYAGYVTSLENNTGNPAAKNPLSSATGDGQFIKSTWLDLIRRYKPELAQGKSEQELLALRADPNLSKEMILAYAKDNAPLLEKAGLPVNDQTLRLMHFGPGNALPVLQAKPDAMVRDILPAGVIEANPTWANITAGDWISKNTGERGDVRALAVNAPEINSIEPPTPKPGQNALAANTQVRPAPTVGSALEALRLLGRKPEERTGSNPLAPQGQQQADPTVPAAPALDPAEIEKRKQQALLSMLLFATSKMFRPVTYDPFKIMPPEDGTRGRQVAPIQPTTVRPMPVMGRTAGLPGQKAFDDGSNALGGLVRG